MFLSLWLIAAYSKHPLEYSDRLNFDFQQRQDEWVVSLLADPVESMPWDARFWITMLGDKCYTCRKIAYDKLKKMGTKVTSWVYLGLRSRDAEIKMRCFNLIRKLYPCTMCYSTGSRIKYEYPPPLLKEIEFLDPCYKCHGFGFILPEWR